MHLVQYLFGLQCALIQLVAAGNRMQNSLTRIINRPNERAIESQQLKCEEDEKIKVKDKYKTIFKFCCINVQCLVTVNKKKTLTICFALTQSCIISQLQLTQFIQDQFLSIE